MNILLIRNLIYLFFIFFNLSNPLNSFTLSELFSRELIDIDNLNKYKNSFSKEDKYSSYYEEDRYLGELFNGNKKLALKDTLNEKEQLEIQSDIQYQKNNVLYAEGNVIVTFKGNLLKADNLIYDKSNETLDAEGDIKLILEEQVFIAEEFKYDFKSEKGNFLKVKGLIKTESFIKNIDFRTYNYDELSSILKTIKKSKVLHTPNGVNNWIFYTDELKVSNNQWTAQKAIFTNDLLESNQVKFLINDLKIIPKENQLEFKSFINFLVLEDKLYIPFWFGNRTIQESEQGYLFGLKPKWYVGLDKLEKDGYFLGRRLNPIELSDNFNLNLEPQFLIQRSIQGYTKSFVAKGDSITSDRSKRDAFFADYFALESKLAGKLNEWDLEIVKKLNSLDSEKFLNALRLKFDLSKEIDFLDSKWTKSFYGVYRDRIWNGSIGESEIYLGYGSKLEKINTWEINGITKTERLTIGFGNFKGEELNSKKLINSYKGSFFYSLDQKFPLLIRDTKNKYVDNSFKYIFEPVKQGIYINTELAALYSVYDNGNHQEYVGFGAGPEFVLGNFKKKYFDYTKLSLRPFYRIKNGDSIFKFDQISDQLTLDISFDQQLYGPLLLKSSATMNLDANSKNYGDFINSQISLNWKKRSYQLGVFYQPQKKSAGINFALYGFE